MATLNLKLRR